jgi:hypothetical protein
MKTRKQYNIWVHKETLEYLKSMKKNKGFSSIEELVFNSVKAMEFYQRWQILKLAELGADKVQTARNDEEMHRKLREMSQ